MQVYWCKNLSRLVDVMRAELSRWHRAVKWFTTFSSMENIVFVRSSRRCHKLLWHRKGVAWNGDRSKTANERRRKMWFGIRKSSRKRKKKNDVRNGLPNDKWKNLIKLRSFHDIFMDARKWALHEHEFTAMSPRIKIIILMCRRPWSMCYIWMAVGSMTLEKRKIYI